MEFKAKDLNIHEKVIIKIPPLLPQSMIDKIQERIRLNKTTVRGYRKYEYLLSGFIYCGKCKYRLTTYMNQRNIRYYRHTPSGREKCENRYIPATELENSVLIHLVKLFGDPIYAEKAIKRATPGIRQVKQLKRDKAELEKRLKEIGKSKNRLVNLVSKGILSDDEIAQEMRKLREREAITKDRILQIEQELKNMPDFDEMKKKSYFRGKIIPTMLKNRPEIVFEKDYEWKRKLIEYAFKKRSPNDKNYGVYVTPISQKKYKVEIWTKIAIKSFNVPLENYEFDDIFDLHG